MQPKTPRTSLLLLEFEEESDQMKLFKRKNELDENIQRLEILLLKMPQNPTDEEIVTHCIYQKEMKLYEEEKKKISAQIRGLIA